jgi:1-acyl-sn-glycerol-3-phosphate acyltransferase
MAPQTPKDTRNIFAPNVELMPTIAKLITSFGKHYNQYKVCGLEHIPQEGGALLVLYHGLVPLDFWYLGLKIYLETGRQPCALVDRWLMKTPGLSWLTRAVGGISGDRAAALELLRKGTLIGVSPGGVREAISGSKNHYKLKWGDRMGFARIAVEAGVPIIPGFTQNVESLYLSPMAEHAFFQKLYEVTRLPIVPIVGLGVLPFPVPLTTWLGEPLRPQAGDTPEIVAERTRTAIEGLIAQHQR